MDHPIPLVFSLADIELALHGAVVTKVIYLEDPEKAIPADVQPDHPIEIPEDSEHAAFDAAQENGRLMAIVRLGNRKPSAAELQTVAVDGTILLPGDKYLKAPVLPSVFAFWAVPFFDPIIGPRVRNEEWFLNGGDRKDRLGIGSGGRLGGLNPTDVSVEYSISGNRRVTLLPGRPPSRITAPRFVLSAAVELLTAACDIRQGLTTNTGRETPSSIKDRTAPMAEIAHEKANESIGRMRASSYVGRVGTSFYVGSSKPMAVGQVEGVKVQGALVEPEQLTAYPTLLPLTVTKTVDPAGPVQSGDIVTITIRYANTGSKAISDVVVSDSLSARLEYVKGSAQTDRPANFTAEENEVASMIVRWELPGSLLPGQAGTIRFKAKVRWRLVRGEAPPPGGLRPRRTPPTHPAARRPARGRTRPTHTANTLRTPGATTPGKKPERTGSPRRPERAEQARTYARGPAGGADEPGRSQEGEQGNAGGPADAAREAEAEERTRRTGPAPPERGNPGADRGTRACTEPG